MNGRLWLMPMMRIKFVAHLSEMDARSAIDKILFADGFTWKILYFCGRYHYVVYLHDLFRAENKYNKT